MESTKRFWMSSVVLLLVVLMSFCLMACDSTVNGVKSETNNVKIELDTTLTHSAVTTNTYKVYYSEEAPDGYKVLLAPYSKCPCWKDFQKFGLDTVEFSVGGPITEPQTAVAFNEVNWEVTIPKNKADTTIDADRTIVATIKNKDTDSEKNTWVIKWVFKAWGKVGN